MNPFGTGAQERPYDPRDYDLASFAVVERPESYQSPVNTIYMQGKYGTCGAHAGAAAANVLNNATLSPKFLWKNIKQIDNFPLDAGTDIRSLFKAWQQFNICDLALLDNSLEDSLQEYSDITEITPEMQANALKKVKPLYAFTTRPSMNQIKDAIYQHKVVILRVACGTGWYTPSWQEKDILPLKLGDFESGHFIAATGYDEKYIYFANSWSTQWGREGIGYFDESYLPNVYEMGVPSVEAKYLFNRDFGYGERSADVHQLQVRLGMPVAYQTGYFGPLTYGAVILYQMKNKIKMTGFVGPLTRASLNT